ncbi:MAG: hypothetical protein H6908_04720, partial [Hyphomicrobiales bacterium]|nr:hypothetical protein [Hyphomicrobiales bacterium]
MRAHNTGRISITHQIATLGFGAVLIFSATSASATSLEELEARVRALEYRIQKLEPPIHPLAEAPAPSSTPTEQESVPTEAPALPEPQPAQESAEPPIRPAIPNALQIPAFLEQEAQNASTAPIAVPSQEQDAPSVQQPSPEPMVANSEPDVIFRQQ